MPSKAARRSIWIIAGFAVVVLAAVALLPFVASTQIVRNRIAHELSDWSGYRVVLRGPPRIHVWPSFQAVLQDVAFLEWGGTGTVPILHSDSIEIELSAIAALRGDVAFSEVSVLRPVLRVAASPDGLVMPVAPGGSRLVRAVATARAVVDANPAEPNLSMMPADPFGAIDFTDGRVLFIDAAGEHEMLSSLSGQISWPALNRAGSLSAKAIWRGEPVALDVSAQQPLALFAGGNSRLTASFSATPIAGSYDGLVTVSKNGFFDGTVKLSSPSLRRALEWSRTEIQPGTAVGTATLSGRLIGDLRRVKIEKAQIVLGGHPGSGVLEFSRNGAAPAVAGTLAFASFDVHSFMSAFMQLPGDGAKWSDPMPTAFTRQLNLDLRLSAAKAVAGPISMTEVAATAQVKDGLAAFDISDATVFGGTLQTGIRFNDRGNKSGSEIRLLASDIDLQALAAALNSPVPLPKSKGTLSIALQGPISRWDTLVENMSGTVSLKLGPGSLAGIDLDAFVKRTEEGGFFPLDDVPSGVVAFNSAEFRASLKEGVARLDTAKAALADRTLSFRGIIPYVGRGLALSGLMAPREDVAASARHNSTTAFFVGGSWNAPFVSPIAHSFPPE